MYLQLTTRCNMKCRHCSESCTRKGIDLPIHLALRAVEVSAHSECALTIGGGEPTMYPEFWRVIRHALMYYTTDYLIGNPLVCVITNGKRKRDAMSLAALGQMGLIDARLSVDPWHEVVDPEVYDVYLRNINHFRAVLPAQVKEVLWETEGCTTAETRRYWADCKPTHDTRATHEVKRIRARGRGKNMVGAVDECCCDDLFVAASGAVWQCGCKKVRLQERMSYDCIKDLQYKYVNGYCSESKEYAEELEKLEDEQIAEWDREELEAM